MDVPLVDPEGKPWHVCIRPKRGPVYNMVVSSDSRVQSRRVIVIPDGEDLRLSVCEELVDVLGQSVEWTRREFLAALAAIELSERPA